MSRAETYVANGLMIVRGPKLTDTEVLSKLDLRDDESAVIIDPEILKRGLLNLMQMERSGEPPSPDKTDVS